VFERFTEGARRSIFFGRHEASAAGSKWIGPAHLVLGILREEPGIAGRIPDLDGLRAELMPDPPSPPVSTSVDMPMSSGSRRALEIGAEYAGQSGHRLITALHLLLGLVDADQKVGEALGRRGFSGQAIQAELIAKPVEQAGEPEADRAALHALIERLPDSFLPQAAAMLNTMHGPVRHAVQPGFRGTASGGGFAIANAGAAMEGHRTWSRREEEGAVVVESHHSHAGHQIVVVERLRLDAGRHALVYTHEVSGPGGVKQTHTVEFPLSEADEAESGAGV
jgi:hypothetical protein